jgi:hypothetical protein
VPPLPSGFTAKGIVALVFSVVAAVLGMASITRLAFPSFLRCFFSIFEVCYVLANGALLVHRYGLKELK